MICALSYPLEGALSYPELTFDTLLAPDFVALDLGCGPGALSQRVLARFPRARCLAVDYDPVLLTLGQRALGDLGGRLRWVEADELLRLYRRVGALVRPGGVVLDGDHFRRGPGWPTFDRLISAAERRREEHAHAGPGAETWREWWAAIAAEPALRDQMAERARRFGTPHGDEEAPILDVHLAALRDAGFREVALIWQHLENGILMAVR